MATISQVKVRGSNRDIMDADARNNIWIVKEATDNLFDPNAEAWQQGYPYSVRTVKEYDIPEKPIYFAVTDYKEDWEGTGGAVLRFCDANDEIVGSVWKAKSAFDNHLRPTRIDAAQQFPDAEYFYIEVNTNEGTISIAPKDVIKRIAVYVGFTAATTIEEAGPLYRSARSGRDAEQDRYLTETDNLFDLLDGTWKQGRGDDGTQTYIVSSRTNHTVQDRPLWFCQKRTGFDGSANGGVVLEIFDAQGNFIDTIWPTTKEIPVSVNILDVFPNANHFRLELHTNSGSIPITPSSAIGKIEAYIGYEEIYSKEDIVPRFVAFGSLHSLRLAKEIHSIKEKISAYNVPDFYENYLESRIADIQGKDVAIGNHGDSFLFITDIHTNNNYYSAALAREIVKKTSVKNVVIGGDYINEPNSKALAVSILTAQRERYMVTDDTVFMMGNHDTNPYGGSGAQLTASEYYGICDKHLEKFIDTERKTYFCRDNNSQKIRYFFVDAGTEGVIDQDQQTWMTEKVGELENNWHIVVFTHFGIYPVVVKVRDNVANYPALNTIKNILSRAVAKVCCVVCGHVHIDISDTTGNYPVIGVTCDANGIQASDSSNDNRTTGTVNEQAFDVFHIDTTAKKIYTTRIGGGQYNVLNGSNLSLNDREFSYT